MREIKFRAWDNLNKKMITKISWILDNFFLCIESSTLEPMQCTGLKDKNCVEIYEGDIMTLDKDKSFTMEVKYMKIKSCYASSKY